MRSCLNMWNVISRRPKFTSSQEQLKSPDVFVTTRSVPETWFVLRMREIASTSCYRQRFYDSLVKWIILRFIYSFKNFS